MTLSSVPLEQCRTAKLRWPLGGVLAHRGLWGTGCQQNSMAAFEQALANQFGIETDVRDRGGELVISHDPATSDSLPLTCLFEMYCRLGATSWLALNVKSDGLAATMRRLIDRYNIENYFLFDMSVPDMRGYLDQGLRVFTRHSEVEVQPAFYEACDGVWLDSFAEPWYSAATVAEHTSAGKQVAVVSPELHGRSPDTVWELLHALPTSDAKLVQVCTDHPEHFLES